MYRDTTERMLAEKKRATISLASFPVKTTMRSRPVTRKVVKKGFGNFLMQKIGLAKRPTKANCNCNSGGNQAVKYCHQYSNGSGSIIDCNSPSKDNTGIAI